MRILFHILTLSLISTLPGRAAEPDWPIAITIATGSAGGTYRAYGEGLARLLTRTVGIRFAAVETAGPSENIQLIEDGTAQVGFVTMGVAQQAWNSAGDWQGETPRREARAVFPMYDTPFHFVVPTGSQIQGIGDLDGKWVGVGPEGGSSETYSPALLRTLGVEASPASGTWDNLTGQLRQGRIDALAVAAGVPFPAVSELEAAKAIRYVPLSPDQILTARLAIPELNVSTIPAGSYPSLMYGYDTVGLYNFAVVDKDLPTSLVYEIVRAVFENHEEMLAIHPAAASTLPKNFVHNTFLPYHSGAIRYYGNAGAPGVLLAD
jgi:TRAP transporter TAXI family solute receptor